MFIRNADPWALGSLWILTGSPVDTQGGVADCLQGRHYAHGTRPISAECNYDQVLGWCYYLAFMDSPGSLQVPPGVYVTVTGFTGTVMRTVTAWGSGKSLQLPCSSLGD